MSFGSTIGRMARFTALALERWLVLGCALAVAPFVVRLGGAVLAGFIARLDDWQAGFEARCDALLAESQAARRAMAELLRQMDDER